MHLRPLHEDHRDAFREMVDYAFRPEDGPDWEDRDRDDPDLFTPLGFYDAPPDSDPDASDLRTVCGSYDFTARVRGEWHAMPGVSAVASPPEGRRRGTVGDMLDALLVRYREEGAAFSALWPFEYPFYRRMGWAICCNHAEATLPPEQLADVVPEANGAFRRLTPDDDLPAMRAVHEAWATESLAVRRTEGWWRERVFRGWRKDPYVFGWFDGEGSLRGYLTYTVGENGDDGDGREMRVWERAAADDEARGHLLRFCRDHDSQVESVTFLALPEWARPIDELSDPRAATLTVKPGPMVRVVDVPRALSALSYDARESVVLAVSDDRCAWNDGTFELRVDAAGAHARRVEGVAAEAPDAELDIGALSQLTVGARDAAELERAGDLTVADASVRPTLDALFPRERTFFREGF